MNNGFMILSREKMSDWRWLNNQTKFYVFFRLLLMANFKDKPFENFTVHRGQLVFSYELLSANLGVSVQTLRTTLRDLQNTNEINIQSTRRHSILTICNYDSWQSENIESNNESTYNQHTINIQSTLSEIKEIKKYNNIKEEDTNVSKKKEKKEKDELFEECWIAYNRKGSKKKSVEYWGKLSEEEKSRVLSHIKAYVGSRERQYQKDFERYLRDKTFNDVISRGNQTVYDPDIFSNSGVYRPTTDGVFQTWNNERGCLMFNGYIHMLNDGYTDDTRPDGAKIAHAQYEWVWSRTLKQWIQQ